MEYMVNSLRLSASITLEWKPQPDITAHELALAIPIITWKRPLILDGPNASLRFYKHFVALPKSVRRHFVMDPKWTTPIDRWAHEKASGITDLPYWKWLAT